MKRELKQPLEFTQAEAAALSFYDERSFRALVDAGAVLATPATRSFGRGKAKLFDKMEVGIASIINRIDFRLNAKLRAHLGDILRTELPEVIHAGKDDLKHLQFAYLIAEFRGNTFGAALRTARSSLLSNDIWLNIDMSASLGGKGPSPLRSFVAASVYDALWWQMLDDETLADLLADRPDREDRLVAAHVEAMTAFRKKVA